MPMAARRLIAVDIFSRAFGGTPDPRRWSPEARRPPRSSAPGPVVHGGAMIYYCPMNTRRRDKNSEVDSCPSVVVGTVVMVVMVKGLETDIALPARSRFFRV